MLESERNSKPGASQSPAPNLPQADAFTGAAMPSKKKRFDPSLQKECRLSRSKIELFVDCPRCFYLDMRCGIDRPPSFPFSLNNEVDRRLKEEFNFYRELEEPHPYMVKAGIDAVPFKHKSIEAWQDALRRGIQYRLPDTNLIVCGGIDDVWQSRGVDAGKLFIVDYKATSQAGVVSLDDRWKDSYKRQAEIYQWLFKMNGFDVSDTALFVFCNARKSGSEFNSRLDFEVSILPHVGDTQWVEPAIREAFNLLRADNAPEPNHDCKWCQFCVGAARF